MSYENRPMGAILIDPNSLRVLSANLAACQLLSRDGDPPQGRPVHDVLRAYEHDGLIALLQGLAPSQPRTVELAWHGRNRDASAPLPMTVELMAPDGERPQVLLSFPCESAAASQHRLLDRVPVMVRQLDERGACTYVNEAWRAFTGRRLEQEREDGWTGALHPDDAIRFQLAMDHALDRRAPLSVDLRLRHRSGAYRWVRYIAHPCEDPSETPAGHMGVCLEIETEHSQAMRLASAQIWMAHVQEIVQLGGWEMEIATGQLETTAEARRLLGQVDDGDGTDLETWRGAVHPEDRPRVMAALGAVLSGKRQQYRTEYRVSQADGAQRHLLEQGQIVMDRLGAPARIVATVLDITERKRHDETLGNLVQGIGARGRAVFDSLVVHLARALDMRFAFLARPVAGDDTWAETLAMSVDGEIVDGLRFPMADSPCQGISEGRPCVYARDVRARYPADRALAEMAIESYLGFPLTSSTGSTLGWLVVMDGRPLSETQAASDLLRVFAARAAVEVERLDTLAASEESARRLRATFEHASVGLALTDLSGRILQTNPALCRLLGWDAEALRGKALAWLVDPRRARLDAARYGELAAGRISHDEAETRCRRRDGSLLELRIARALVRDDRGQPECVLHVIEERPTRPAVDHAWAMVG